MAGFADIIGHEPIIAHLKRAAAAGRVSHAYIFDGEEHTGKRMLADAFARMLLCEQPGNDACGVCKSCKQFAGGNQPDLIRLTHEKPNTISVDDIRRQVGSDIMIRPYRSRYKIYLIDEAQKMNVQAQNALLKTLEEPPSYAVILLLTTNAQQFLPTIRSRCVTFHLRPVPPDKITSFLMRRCQVPDYRAGMCAAFSQGRVGQAMELSGSEEFRALKELAVSQMKRIASFDAEDITQEVAKIRAFDERIGEYLDLLQMWFRDLLLCKCGVSASRFVYLEQERELMRLSEKISWGGIEAAFTLVSQARRRIRANVNKDLTFELMLSGMQQQMQA